MVKKYLAILLLLLCLWLPGCHGLNNLHQPRPILFGGTLDIVDTTAYFALRPFAIVRYPFYVLFLLVDLPFTVVVDTLGVPMVLLR